jgi:hypothetical protein
MPSRNKSAETAERRAAYSAEDSGASADEENDDYDKEVRETQQQARRHLQRAVHNTAYSVVDETLANSSQLANIATVVAFDQTTNDRVRALTSLNPAVIVNEKTGKTRNDFRGWSANDKRAWKSAKDSIRVRRTTTMSNDAPRSVTSISSGSNVSSSMLDASMSSTSFLTCSQTRRLSTNSTHQNDDEICELFDACEQPCTLVLQ